MWNRFWLWLDAAGIVLAVIAIVSIRTLYPESADRDTDWRLLAGALLFHFMISFLWLYWFPWAPRIRVFPTHIEHDWTGTNQRIMPADIVSASIDLEEPHRPVLVVTSIGRKGGQCTRRRGIAEHVDLQKLRDRLESLAAMGLGEEGPEGIEAVKLTEGV